MSDYPAFPNRRHIKLHEDGLAHLVHPDRHVAWHQHACTIRAPGRLTGHQWDSPLRAGLSRHQGTWSIPRVQSIPGSVTPNMPSTLPQGCGEPLSGPRAQQMKTENPTTRFNKRLHSQLEATYVLRQLRESQWSIKQHLIKSKFNYKDTYVFGSLWYCLLNWMSLWSSLEIRIKWIRVLLF